MKLRSTLLSALSLLLLSSAASADVEVRDHRDVEAEVGVTATIKIAEPDTTGWTLLGQRTVRKMRKDTIKVGAQQGKFDQLMLMVDSGFLNVRKVTVFFGNGQKHHVDVKHLFKKGSRSRALELPGDDRIITKIELKYRSKLGTRAQVRVYGRNLVETVTPPPPPPPEPPAYTPPVFDSKGWMSLGERTVDGKHDRDVLLVGKDDGRFSRIQFVVYDSDLILEDITIKFSNGEKMSTTKKLVFAEGSRTGAIDLPGETRFIEHISFRYSNVAGGGNARIVAYGLPAPVETKTKVKVRDHRKHR